ncbi:MAG: hypothetical protein Fur0021_23830 [Candidatus Promineifilaceae bacterium]
MSSPSSPDLYALMIRLTAGISATLHATQGHLAHAAFLDILRQADPDLSHALHTAAKRKPFTISPLQGFGYGQNGQLHLRAGQEGWLRITLLDSALFHTFIQYFLHPQNRPIIQLQHIPFQVSEILSTPGSHPLAGYNSFDNLFHHWAEKPLTPQDLSITLHFRSPTAFSRRGLDHRAMHVLPDPYFVFGELARYWDTYTGHEIMEDCQNFAAESVVVARHEIATHIYQFGPHVRQVGFAGTVTFEIKDKTETALIQHLNRLADLAFYTGLGYKTTMGMGQVVRRYEVGGKKVGGRRYEV